MKKTYITLPLLSLALLSSCSLYSKTELPKTSYNKWSEAQTINNKSVDEKWWENFSDNSLNRIISLARQNNKDIQIAIARINQARAGQLSTIAENLPTVNSTIAAGRNRASTSLSSRPFTKKYYNNYRAEFDSTWEISIFRLEPAYRAAKLNMQKSNEELNDVLVSLYADVASNYFEVRKLQLQLSLQSQITSDIEAKLKLQKDLYKSGNIDNIELSTIKTELNSAKALQTQYSNALKIKTYALESLVGLKPNSLGEVLNGSFSYSTPEVAKIALAPAEVLAKRPDVRIAGKNLEYSGALQDVAYGNLFPKISISGLLGFESGRYSSFLNSGSQAWGISGGLVAPILDFKKLRADLDLAEADKQEAFANYQKVVNNALSEVEASFASLTSAEDDLHFKNSQYAITAVNAKLTSDKYKQGLVSYIDYLQVRKSKLQSEIELEQSKFDKINQSIRVYKALGGGWNN